MKMMQAVVSGRLAIATLCTILVVATTASATTALTFLLTTETLLSGSSLFDCDPDPTAASCEYGITATITIGRRHAVVNDAQVFVLPKLDTISALPSLHPYGVEVNVEFYERINSQYPALGNLRILGYVVDPSDLARETDSSYTSLRLSSVSPLSSTVDIPPMSEWRIVVKTAMVVDLVTMEPISVLDALTTTSTNAKCAILRVDDADSLWTTSTRVSPLKYGTRLGGDHLTSTSSTTYSTARIVSQTVTALRRNVGLIVIFGSDTTIPLVTLLEDMLALEIEEEYLANATSSTTPLYSYLPDMYVDTTDSAVQPSSVNITVSYVTSKGQIITKTKFVLVAGVKGGSAASSRLEFILDLAEVQGGAGRLATYSVNATVPVDSVNSSNSNIVTMTRYVPNWLKSSAYYDDQALLLNYSRAALANDRIVGRTLEEMPDRINATLGYPTCYAGECAQGTLITRALRTQLDTDVSFVSSGIPEGEAWPAGNITEQSLFTVYTKVDTPCRAIMTGLRIWRIVTNAFALRAYTSSGGARIIQMSGVRMTYAVQTTGYAKVASIDVLNRTTDTYEPLERLKYYSVASTSYHCTQWQQHVFNNLYSGESIDADFSSQLIPPLMADYLIANNPYDPLFENYITQITADNDTEYLDYPLGYDACNSNQSYDAGVDSCLDCPEGYNQSATNISKCELVPIEEVVEEVVPVVVLQQAADNSGLILALSAGGGGLLVVVVVLAVLCECWRRSGSRSNHNAPNGSTDVAVIFTDIKTSTKLWGAVPASMGIALDAHHSLIRGAISAYRGYEVKTVGDSFMIVVDDAQRAVDLAVAIQNALYDYEWPTAIDDSYACNFSEAIMDDPDDVCGPEVDAPWNGLRVRIGIHYGPVEVILDEVTKGYDYYGTTVNVAARVEGVTDGGQVCASAAVLAAVTPTSLAYTSMLLAKTALRGVREEMEVYEIRSTHLPARTFNNPLIFDDDAKANMINQQQCAEAEGSSMSTRAAHTTQLPPLTNTTRPIRNIIREAFKAVRGSERVQLLEKLRSAWRVELPSGKAFRGISAAQLAKKEHAAAKPIKKRAPNGRNGLSQSGTTDRSSFSTHRRSDVDSEIASTVYSHSSDADEYDEEDYLFHVIAQRVEPSVATLFKTAQARRRASSIQMNNSTEVVSFNLSGGGYTAGSIVIDNPRRTSVFSPSTASKSGTSLANLFDVKSFLGTSGASANPGFSVGGGGGHSVVGGMSIVVSGGGSVIGGAPRGSLVQSMSGGNTPMGGASAPPLSSEAYARLH